MALLSGAKTLYGSTLQGASGELQMDADHDQRELLPIGDVEFAVSALGVGFHRSQTQLHLSGDCGQLLALEDVLDYLDFLRREPELSGDAKPIYSTP